MGKRFSAFLMVFLLATSVGCRYTPGDITVETSLNSTSAALQAPDNSGSTPSGSGTIPLAISVDINGVVFSATLHSNETAQGFYAMLPITLGMDDLNSNEKYGYLTQNLPSDTQSVGTILAGDIMLYGSNCVVLFYDTFPSGYHYTPIGRFESVAGLADAVGNTSVEITFAPR